MRFNIPLTKNLWAAGLEVGRRAAGREVGRRAAGREVGRRAAGREMDRGPRAVGRGPWAAGRGPRAVGRGPPGRGPAFSKTPILWFICTAFKNLLVCNFGAITGSLCERFSCGYHILS